MNQSVIMINSLRTSTVSQGLGGRNDSRWYPVNTNDWSLGAISWNDDVSFYDPSICTYDPAVAAVSIGYTCTLGNNSVSIVYEPLSSDSVCLFKFVVDSSVVCDYAARYVLEST